MNETALNSEKATYDVRSTVAAEAYKRGLLRNVMRTKPMTAVPVWAPMLMLIDAFV